MTTSRNKREGYYAGWRRLMLDSGHCRTGLPTAWNDYLPALDPLPRKRGKPRRAWFAVNLTFRTFRPESHARWDGAVIYVKERTQ